MTFPDYRYWVRPVGPHPGVEGESLLVEACRIRNVDKAAGAKGDSLTYYTGDEADCVGGRRIIGRKQIAGIPVFLPPAHQAAMAGAIDRHRNLFRVIRRDNLIILIEHGHSNGRCNRLSRQRVRWLLYEARCVAAGARSGPGRWHRPAKGLVVAIGQILGREIAAAGRGHHSIDLAHAGNEAVDQVLGKRTVEVAVRSQSPGQEQAVVRRSADGEREGTGGRLRQVPLILSVAC